MSEVVVKARGLLEERRSELRGELEEVERALRALGGRASGTPKNHHRSRRRRKPGRSRKRGSRERREAALVEFAKRNAEASNREIAKALKVSPSYVSQMLARLGKAGALERRDGRLVVRA